MNRLSITLFILTSSALGGFTMSAFAAAPAGQRATEGSASSPTTEGNRAERDRLSQDSPDGVRPAGSINASSTQRTTEGSASSTQPNIIFILADDWGLGDVKTYGGDRCKIDTPHMDRLAETGMKFTDAHSSSAVCTQVFSAVSPLP